MPSKKKNPVKELFTTDDAETPNPFDVQSIPDPHDSREPEDIPEPVVPKDSEDINDPFTDTENTSSSVEDSLIGAVLGRTTTLRDIEDRQAALYLETGTYEWTNLTAEEVKSGKENPVVTITFSEKDIYPSDLAQQTYRDTQDLKFKNKGRCYIRVSGRVTNIANSKKKGRFEISVSPDYRRRPNSEDEEADFMYKYYAMAEVLYFQLNDENPESPSDVVRILGDAGYSMYITRGKDRNYLNRLQPLVSAK